MSLNDRCSEGTVWPPQPIREDVARKYHEFVADEYHFRMESRGRVSRWELIQELRREYRLTFADAKAIIWDYCAVHHILPLYQFYLLGTTGIVLLLCIGSFAIFMGRELRTSTQVNAHNYATVMSRARQDESVSISVLLASLGFCIVMAIMSYVLDLRHRKNDQRNNARNEYE